MEINGIAEAMLDVYGTFRKKREGGTKDGSINA
jgi:hypothetical protein